MRKAVLPLFVSLLLCGVATGALVVTKARAQSEPLKPMMVAMAGPGTMMAQNTAAPPAPPAQLGTRHRPSPADIAARRKERCDNQYARQVGRLAYLEARLGLTESQQSLFSAWRAVKLDIAKRNADACAQRDISQNRKEISPVDRMNRMEDQLKKHIADLDAQRPAFAALYGALTPDQQKMLAPHRHGTMRRAMGRRHRMGRGMMRPGGRPMGPPPPPPPQ